MRLNQIISVNRKFKIVIIALLIGLITLSNNKYADDLPDKEENSSNPKLEKTEAQEESSPKESEENTTSEEKESSPTISDSAQKLISLSNKFYSDFTKGRNMKFPNENMSRMHKFAVTYDTISRDHFSRGVTRLPSQREIPELISYALKGDWNDQVKRMTSAPIYGYSESRAVRILVSTHTVANSYNIPFPTFFCLLFQESQFDFKVRSKTGATGLGQLTGIAIRQLQMNRKKSSTERQLQNTISNLGSIYKDPVFKEVLSEMGFKAEFPDIKHFPKSVASAGRINDKFSNDIAKQLVKQGHSYGKNIGLVRKLTGQVSRGILLPKQYAAVHTIYLETLTKAKNNLGSTLNIETNIVLSAMLLRYYMDYPWRANGQRIRVQPEVNAILAVAAYNQGPGGVQRYLTQFKRSFPHKDLNKMTLNDFRSTFTSSRVANALKQTPGQAKEVFEHVWKVKLCSHNRITRPRSNAKSKNI